jgi:hypothetical protein
VNLAFEAIQFRNNEIIAFRTAVYRQTYGSKTNLKLLEWSLADEKSVHLVLRDTSTQNIQSYLRFTLFKRRDHLSQALRMSVGEQVTMPCVLLSRASTLPAVRSLHLHSILRCRALQLALKLGLQTVVGSLESNSARLNQILSLGYECVQNQDFWKDGIIQNSCQIYLVQLAGTNKIENAIRILNQKLTFTVEKINHLNVEYL